MTRANPETRRAVRQAACWLLEYLESATSPPLVRDIQAVAKDNDIPAGVLRVASQELPIIRQPRELRGPWTWRLPQPEELVQVRFYCPIEDCQKVSEGWMEFRLSRILFTAGLVHYLTRGRLRRVQRPGGHSIFLRLEPEE